MLVFVLYACSCHTIFQNFANSIFDRKLGIFLRPLRTQRAIPPKPMLAGVHCTPTRHLCGPTKSAFPSLTSQPLLPLSSASQCTQTFFYFPSPFFFPLGLFVSGVLKSVQSLFNVSGQKVYPKICLSILYFFHHFVLARANRFEDRGHPRAGQISGAGTPNRWRLGSFLTSIRKGGGLFAYSTRTIFS